MGASCHYWCLLVSQGPSRQLGLSESSWKSAKPSAVSFTHAWSTQDTPDVVKEGPHLFSFSEYPCQIGTLSQKATGQDCKLLREKLKKKKKGSMTSLSLIQAGPGKQHQLVCKWLLLWFWSPKGVSIPGMLLNMGQLFSWQQPLYVRAIQFACMWQQKMSFAFKTIKYFCALLLQCLSVLCTRCPLGIPLTPWLLSFSLSPLGLSGRPFIFWDRLGASHGLQLPDHA